MRILTISDKIVPSLYSAGIRSQIGDVDLILSCGDLPYYYIDYIVSMLDKPAYFVYGNHAHVAEYWSNNTVMSAPGGAVNLHGRTFCEQGLLLAGLEGSIRYNRGPFQYTDSEMWGNIARMIPGLLYNRMRCGRWLDVLVCHSPPRGIHDESDRAHTGFKSFLAFMRYFRPRYLLHGHIHIYRNDTITCTRYLETDVMNVYPYRILEIDPQSIARPGGSG